MALPSMRSGVISREFLRIAGGYGAPAQGRSPAGGLDIDNAGNLATDGELTADGVVQSNSALRANGNAGTARAVQFTTGGATRWDLVASDVAESGSNAGSNLELRRYSDTGALLGTPLRVTRSSGVIELLGHTDALNGFDVNGGFGGGGTSIDSTGVRVEGYLLSKATASTVAIFALDDAARGGDLRFQCTRAGVGTWYFGVDATDNEFKFDYNHGDFGSPAIGIKTDRGVAFYGIQDFKGTMGNSYKDPTMDSPVDWVEIKINGVTRYLPAYTA